MGKDREIEMTFTRSPRPALNTQPHRTWLIPAARMPPLTPTFVHAMGRAGEKWIDTKNRERACQK